jgi:hypothetical protein
MNSSLSSGTHHVFFPPRFELVLCQDHPHRFAADLVDYAALDRVFGEQPNRPSSAPVRWRPAHQRDQCSLLRAVQFGLAAGPRLLAERVVQASGQVALGHSRNFTRITAQRFRRRSHRPASI